MWVYHDISNQMRLEQAQRLMTRVSAQLAAAVSSDEAIIAAAKSPLGGMADACLLSLGGAFQKQRLHVMHIEREEAARIEHVLLDAWGDTLPLHLDQGVLQTQWRDIQGSCLAHEAAFLAPLRTLGVRSVLFVPLILGGRILGSFTLLDKRVGRYVDAFAQRLIVDLAQRMTVALDRIEIFQAQQVAVRSRDDVLAVVSHDLKGMLSSIQLDLMAVERLQKLPAQRCNLTKSSAPCVWGS